MKRTLLITLAATALATGIGSAAQATEVGYSRKYGLGFVLGSPTGISGKMWVSSTNALDAALGFWGYGFSDQCFTNGAGQVVCDRFGYSHGTFNMDYLWQSNIVRGTAQLDWHVGAGGRAVWFGGCNNNCVLFAARAPIGLDLMFSNPSFLELFFELAPAIYFFPYGDFDVEASLGVRLYF